MASILPDTRLLGLYAGIPTDTPGYLFLQTGQLGQLEAWFQYLTGSAPLFTLNGKVLYSNTGTPASSLGSSGDFFISENLYKFYGPKSGSWPSSGVSMVGPTGATGPIGPTGVAGSGISGFTGGYIGDVLLKNSNTNFDFGWAAVGDLLRQPVLGISRPSRYKEVYRNLGLRGPSGSTVSTDMGSGCTYNPLSNTIYVCDNGTPSIVEYSIDGQYIRTINLSGFKDVEAIDFLYGTTHNNVDYYYMAIVEEYNASGSAYLNRIQLLRIPLTGNATITYNPGTDNHDYEIDLSPFLTNAAPNVGIEGIAYNPSRNIFYVVTEKTANEGWKCWEVANSAIESISELFDLTSALSTFGITDITDICYRREQNTLVMVSEEGAGAIIEFGVSGPDLGSIFDYTVAPSAFYQLEGISFSPNGRFMFLTGEAALVAGDKPDYAIYEWNDGSNPSTNEQSHGLLYFQNGIATSIKGKIFELPDAYGTSTNNTNKSLTTSWPVGSRTLQSDFIKRGRKLSFSSFGEFVPNTPTTGSAILNFQVQDTGDAALTPLLSISGVSCHTTSYWSYDGQIAFSESGYYNKSYAIINNASGFSSIAQICSSGSSSIFATGDIDFVTRFSIPSTTGTLNTFQFSIDID